MRTWVTSQKTQVKKKRSTQAKQSPRSKLPVNFTPLTSAAHADGRKEGPVAESDTEVEVLLDSGLQQKHADNKNKS